MAVIIRPITEAEMKMADSSIKVMWDGGDTLCNRIREVYKAVNFISEEDIKIHIQEECKKMLVYAKRMDNALKQAKNVREYGI